MRLAAPKADSFTAHLFHLDPVKNAICFTKNTYLQPHNDIVLNVTPELNNFTRCMSNDLLISTEMFPICKRALFVMTKFVFKLVSEVAVPN